MAQKRRKPWAKFPISRFPFSPSTYPGRRPRFSFLFTHEGIYRFRLRALDRMLEDRGLPPASERYAVLAYGSNACPTQLLNKYRRDSRLTNMPVLFGRLHGAEAVYTRRRTTAGYVPATLARKSGSRPSWITLLTAQQLEAMDRTEGRPNYYVLAEVGGVYILHRQIAGCAALHLCGYSWRGHDLSWKTSQPAFR